MRITAFLTALATGLAAATPLVSRQGTTVVKIRDLCVCNESRCEGPPCCDNGTC
ncbi:hypothetical protein ANO14919_142090 [Xylariales sp. No.14919]|nr:hypothetical protein ANO14919_142090 [Xylariales sp. No.14919]